MLVRRFGIWFTHNYAVNVITSQRWHFATEQTFDSAHWQPIGSRSDQCTSYGQAYKRVDLSTQLRLSLIMRAEMVLETSATFSHLTILIAEEDFIKDCDGRVSFISYCASFRCEVHDNAKNYRDISRNNTSIYFQECFALLWFLCKWYSVNKDRNKKKFILIQP